MKIKCIENTYYDLTIDKTYVVIDEDEDWYWVIDDNGRENWHWKYFFKTLSELRNDKINKLLE